MADRDSGAAMRRQRRLRSWWRHERHVPAPQRTAPRDGQGRGVGARVELYGDDPGPPTPQPEPFNLFEAEPGEARPDRLSTLSRPQERVLRRTVLQLVDAVPSLPTLDDPSR